MDALEPLALSTRDDALKWVKAIVIHTIYKFNLKLSEREDLIAEGYLMFCICLENYTSCRKNSFKAYVETRIRGAVLDYVRRETRRSIPGVVYLLSQLESDGLQLTASQRDSCPENRALLRSLWRRLHADLDKIEPEDRQIFVEFTVNGKTCSEIAAECSRKTASFASKRIKKVREELRQSATSEQVQIMLGTFQH